jgi:hypothetical protein
MVALRMSIQQHVTGFEDNSNQPNFSSSRDIISLKRCWNAARLGKLRLALHFSLRNRQNLLLKEIILATGGFKKIAAKFPNFW